MNTEQRQARQGFKNIVDASLIYNIENFETNDENFSGQMYPIYINCNLYRFKVEEIIERDFESIFDADSEILLVLDKQFSEDEYPDPVSAAIRINETSIEIPCLVSKSQICGRCNVEVSLQDAELRYKNGEIIACKQCCEAFE